MRLLFSSLLLLASALVLPACGGHAGLGNYGDGSGTWVYHSGEMAGYAAHFTLVVGSNGLSGSGASHGDAAMDTPFQISGPSLAQMTWTYPNFVLHWRATLPTAGELQLDSLDAPGQTLLFFPAP